MKKIFLSVVVIHLFCTACSKREDALKPSGGTVVKEFVASFRSNDGDTKTSLYPKGKVMWDEGDTIRYYSSANGMVNEYVVPENAATVTIPAKVAENDTWIIAAYGGKISEKHSGSSLELENAVNAEQSGKFRDAHVSLAGTRFSTGNNLHFWNLTSLIKFAFDRNDVAYITLKSKDQTKLHGDGRLQCIIDDTEIVTRFPEDAGGDSVKVDVGRKGEYYISTLPCNIKGFTISLFNEDGFSLGYIESSKTLSLGDGEIINLGKLDSLVRHRNIKSVSLDRDTVPLMAGSSYKLNAVIDPSGALVKGYRWSVTDPSVYVDSVGDGTVYAMKKGEASVILEVRGIGADGKDTTVKDSCHFVIHDFSEAINLGAGRHTSNCYMINDFTPNMYKFDCACKGNDYQHRVMHPASVEVVWESFGTDEVISEGDLVYVVAMKDDSVAFATTGREGNALLAAKDDKGNILWSWHIWITDYPSYQVYKNGQRMLDRNLGALSSDPNEPSSLGLYYQWGRKDPFLGSSSIKSYLRAESTLSSWPQPVEPEDHLGGSPATTLDYSISHPTTFINGNPDSWDWYCVNTLNRNEWLWRDYTGKKKTIYDPCPVGYRVPIDTVWSKSFGKTSTFDHIALNCGMNFGKDMAVESEPQLGKDDKIWYPSAGCYLGTSGVYVGNAGYWWGCNHYYEESVPSFLYSCYMQINTSYRKSNVSPKLKGKRYEGYSVRCEYTGTN